MERRRLEINLIYFDGVNYRFFATAQFTSITAQADEWERITPVEAESGYFAVLLDEYGFECLAKNVTASTIEKMTNMKIEKLMLLSRLKTPYYRMTQNTNTKENDHGNEEKK